MPVARYQYCFGLTSHETETDKNLEFLLGDERGNEEPKRKAVNRKWQCVAGLTSESKTATFLHFRKSGFLPHEGECTYIIYNVYIIVIRRQK
jgi:hypothetical protein